MTTELDEDPSWLLVRALVADVREQAKDLAGFRAKWVPGDLVQWKSKKGSILHGTYVCFVAPRREPVMPECEGQREAKFSLRKSDKPRAMVLVVQKGKSLYFTPSVRSLSASTA